MFSNTINFECISKINHESLSCFGRHWQIFYYEEHVPFGTRECATMTNWTIVAVDNLFPTSTLHLHRNLGSKLSLIEISVLLCLTLSFFLGFLLILSTWNDFWVTLRLGWMGFEYQHQLSWHGGCAIHRGEWCSSVWFQKWDVENFDGCEPCQFVATISRIHVNDDFWSIRLPMKVHSYASMHLPYPSFLWNQSISPRWSMT